MSDKPKITMPDFEYFIKTGNRVRPRPNPQNEFELEDEDMIEGVEREKLSVALQLVLGDWHVVRSDIVVLSQVKESAIDRARYDKKVPFIKRQAAAVANALGLTLDELLELGDSKLEPDRLLILQAKVDGEIQKGRIKRSNRRRPFSSRKIDK